MTVSLDIEVTGIEALFNKLAEMTSPDAQRYVAEQVGAMLRGKLQRYPPYKYVSRKQAYGKTFFSEAQRRYVMMAIRKGIIQIPYHRTQNLSKNWRVVTLGPVDVYLTNDTAYRQYVQDDGTQARMMALRDWKTVQTVISESGGQIQTTADEAYNRYIKRISR